MGARPRRVAKAVGALVGSLAFGPTPATITTDGSAIGGSTVGAPGARGVPFSGMEKLPKDPKFQFRASWGMDRGEEPEPAWHPVLLA
jgi:hypothetical protein